ncbi:hypothetical protein PIROE2DRAFT_16658, partial [Piromyces sp. E2]
METSTEINSSSSEIKPSPEIKPTPEVQSKKKRIFPKIHKCWCISLQAAVKLFTLLMTVIYIAIFVYKVYTEGFNVETVLDLIILICVIASLITLIIGMYKVKLSYLRQFKYVFLVYIIYLLAKTIYTIYSYYINDDFHDSLVIDYQKKYASEKLSGKQIRNLVKIKSLLTTSFTLLSLIFT